MRPVSDWMMKHIQDARQLFGVGGVEWHVKAQLTDKPLGDSCCDGGVDTNSVYLNATIELHEDLADNETSRAVIYHEVLHIPHEEVDHLVSAIIEELPVGDRQRYHDLYEQTLERFIQRVSRSVSAGLRKDSEL